MTATKARTGATVAAALLAAVLAPGGPAAAAPAARLGAVAEAPSLTVSGLATADGLVRFTLTGRDLAGPARLDPATVQVWAGATELRSTAVVAAATPADAPPRAVMVVLDATARVPSSQFDAARAAITSLAVGLPGDVQLGLVTMAATVTTVAPSTDRAAFTAALAAVTRAGSTNLPAGVMAATAALRGPGLTSTTTAGAGAARAADRRLFVVSDGRDASATLTDAARVDLSSDAIPIDMVAYAAGSAGAARLQQYTTPTGGRLVPAADRAGVAAAAAGTAAAFPPVLVVTATVPPELAGTTSTLDIVVASAGVSTTEVVSFDGRLAPATTGSPGRGAGWLAYGFAGLIFVALVALVLILAWPRALPNQRIRQIAHFGPGRTRSAPRLEVASTANAISRAVLNAAASVVRVGGLQERVALRLERAGMRMQPHEWVLLRAVITVVAGIAVGALLGLPAVVLGLALGWLGTMAFQTVRVERRANQFADNLPDALQLVIGSLKSGFSLSQALESLVRESPDPVGAEFGRALTEHRLGADISDALERVAQRTGSEDLGWAVMAVRIQREVGGNLVEVLQTTVDTMRERARLRRHVRSLSAEGRLSAWVLIALPVALGLFMFTFRRSYLTPLVTEPVGVMMLLGGGVIFVAGIVWITRVIKVEA